MLAFLGRRSRCGAGGRRDSVGVRINPDPHTDSNTGPESPVPRAPSGWGGAGLCPAGATAGQERE
jgi:hypothetical protein